jgi:hypothetical protein
LAEERQILKEISGIKRIKTQVNEYFLMEKQVQDLKVRYSHRVGPNIGKLEINSSWFSLITGASF